LDGAEENLKRKSRFPHPEPAPKMGWNSPEVLEKARKYLPPGATAQTRLPLATKADGRKKGKGHERVELLIR